MIHRLAIIAGLIMAGIMATPVGAGPPTELPMPTMGGKQFWADEYFFHQWRIQRHVLTGHCRLLDEHDLRYFSGTYEQCREKLDEIRLQRHLPPMRGKGVVVLHGLFRSRSAMSKFCDYLRREGGYEVFNVTYPSTRRDVAGHAQSLARVVESLEGIEEINFVAHSMGNIVVRHYLADQAAKSGGQIDPRIRRFVMLAPPNHGSLMAHVLAENNVLDVITGDAVRQLGQDWEQLQPSLATPTCEFGILAGGKGDETGYNPLLPGDDDGTVCVASTRLAGARDFAILPVLHSFITQDEQAMQFTLRFLQNGYFVSARRRLPLDEPDPAEADEDAAAGMPQVSPR